MRRCNGELGHSITMIENQALIQTPLRRPMIMKVSMIAISGVCLLFLTANLSPAQDVDASAIQDSPHESSKATDPASVLSPDEWHQVDAAANKALSWLAAQQQVDGSFPTLDLGQPGITALCMMAFISHGHVPGDGRYGQTLERATDFVLSCQKQNGLITMIGPDGPRITRNVEREVGASAVYNHAISGLVLSELYGMSEDKRAPKIQAVINKALVTSLKMQRWPKGKPDDRGGWRYLYDESNLSDSDLSITGWELMFLRSARNAGFNVPKEPIDQAVEYVQRCYSKRYGVFQYITFDEDHRSRGMAGAGILALAHAGFHGAPAAQQSGEWLLRHNFDRYNALITFNPDSPHERYHYSLLMCCQGMYQLGGRYWEEFFPRTVQTLLENQQADGSWPADKHWRDNQFGNAYTTALVVIALGAPNQLLPIFQR